MRRVRKSPGGGPRIVYARARQKNLLVADVDCQATSLSSKDEKGNCQCEATDWTAIESEDGPDGRI